MAQQIHHRNVVGREVLIKRIWRKLESGSLRFTAERRIGKTTVMLKMAAEPSPGCTPVFIDLEGIASPEEFVEKLLSAVKGLLSATQSGKALLGNLLKAVGGTEIGSVVKIPKIAQTGWAPTLDKLIEQLCKNQSKTRVLLLLDELPYMLQSIASEPEEGPRKALKILDRMRAARQAHPNLRMVFAGSVGLHHVLGSLRNATQASQPVNDMELVEIKPLDTADAITLTERLVKSEGLEVAPEAAEEFAAELAKSTDCVPFYLERVVSRLAERRGPVTLDDARRIVREHLTNDEDRWEMEHFRTRLKIYYPGTHVDAQGSGIRARDLACSILDSLALARAPQPIDAIWASLKAQHPLTDRGYVIQMLSSLAKDHYLMTDANKAYCFRFPLIQAWWITAQGLSK